jgi:hypothetical protein
MLLLNSNSNMRYYIENHTKLYGEPGRTTNTTLAEWKAAVKKSFTNPLNLSPKKNIKTKPFPPSAIASIARVLPKKHKKI